MHGSSQGWRLSFPMEIGDTFFFFFFFFFILDCSLHIVKGYFGSTLASVIFSLRITSPHFDSVLQSACFCLILRISVSFYILFRFLI